MKQYLFIVAFLIGFNCFGQDTTRSFSRSSISIYAGADEITSFTMLSVTAGPWASPIKPYPSSQAFFSFSYDYALKKVHNVLLGLKVGVGYSNNTYMGSIAWEVAYGSPMSLEQIETGECSVGIFANVLITDKLSWYNEFDVIGDAQLSAIAETNMISPSVFSDNNNIDLRLFYQTGICYKLNKAITLAPLLGWAFADISPMSNKTNSSGVYGYTYFREGFKVTYNINGR